VNGYRKLAHKEDEMRSMRGVYEDSPHTPKVRINRFSLQRCFQVDGLEEHSRCLIGNLRFDVKIIQARWRMRLGANP
jgi:hypothetical protein